MLIDSHAHLDFPEFEGEIDALLTRAQQAGVDRIITIGTSVESSRRAVALAERHPQIYAAIGIHPGSVMEEAADAVEALRPLCAHPRVVAIGEIGLDHYRLPETGVEAFKAAQETLFRQQLDLAAEHGLNVVIHQRGDCFEAAFGLLSPYLGKIRAVFHCFGGTPADAARLHAAGCLVSFTGIVTFKNAPLMQSCAVAVPDGSYMVETDCPYLAPVPFRGQRSEPAFVRQSAEKIAALRGQTLEQVAATTTAAAEAFFRLPR